MAVGGSWALRVVLILSVSICHVTNAARDLTETSTTVPKLPAQISIPAGYELKMLLSAKGYQYWEFDGSAWVNNNATAALYNMKKQEVGLHYFLPHPDSLGGQPSWDTLPSKGFPYSAVTCKVEAKVVEAKKNVAWALLGATQSAGDKNYFGEVAYIQRYNTYHGAQPDLKASDRKGHIWKSRYTCIYAFYVKAT